MAKQSRRDFLGVATVGAATGWSAAAARPRRILVEMDPEASFRRKLAARELLRGLERLRLPAEVRYAEPGARPGAGELIFRLRVAPERFRDPAAHEISAAGEAVRLAAGNSRALLEAVFDFLERQGAFFGLDGESYPPEGVAGLRLPPQGQGWKAAPRFQVRGLLPWPDFLNCITVYNEEDFLAYFEAMLRMRMNLFGMHVYSGSRQWAESYLSFEFGGAGHIAYLDTTATRRWGYLPVRTSRFTMGGDQFFDREVFGSDAARLSRDLWEQAEATRALLRKGFAYAKRLGIETGIGFEPYQIPDEIWRALPPEVRPAKLPPRGAVGARFDIESVTARKMLEARLGELLDAYPDVSYVWLWEDERMNWESRRTGIPLSTTPFMEAYDFLRRHAPDKRLVVSGWGGVARNFEHFHRKLPGDVVFSCLSDTLGWDPVNEVFGKLGERERWPIPWLEDDPGMWQAQFHAFRFERDVHLAARYGCQGMLGIHWRHRTVDPTLGYFARAMWDEKLTPTQYYKAYAASQAGGQRAPRLATLLTNVDRHQELLTTWTGKIGKDGHALIHAFSGDYSEAFTFWNHYVPGPAVVASQKRVLAELDKLIAVAGSAYERERLGYWKGHVGFLVAYADCWTLAHRLQGVLSRAAELKKAGRGEAARRLVANEGVPLWLELAPRVRAAMLAYQSIVATRNGLGALASRHIKLVRLALYRLPLSIQEYLGEMPPAMEKTFTEVTQPDPKAPSRLFLPTRPGLLDARTKTRIMIVAPGPAAVERVMLHLQFRGQSGWRSRPAKLLGLRTWQAFLGPFPSSAGLARYYVSARAGGKTLTAPLDAPEHCYHLTLI